MHADLAASELAILPELADVEAAGALFAALPKRGVLPQALAFRSRRGGAERDGSGRYPVARVDV